MGAPRYQRRKEDRPQEITEAAFGAFAENGFTATKVEDVARRAGVIDQVDAQRIVVRATEDLEPGDPGVDIYRLRKFQRSNQNTCINQRPLVKVGDRVGKGEVSETAWAPDRRRIAAGLDEPEEAASAALGPAALHHGAGVDPDRTRQRADAVGGARLLAGHAECRRERARGAPVPRHRTQRHDPLPRRERRARDAGQDVDTALA